MPGVYAKPSPSSFCDSESNGCTINYSRSGKGNYLYTNGVIKVFNQLTSDNDDCEIDYYILSSEEFNKDELDYDGIYTDWNKTSGWVSLRLDHSSDAREAYWHDQDNDFQNLGFYFLAVIQVSGFDPDLYVNVLGSGVKVNIDV